MSQYTISLAQMNIALGDVEKNIATFHTMTAQAANRSSNVVIFPELWSTGYVLDQPDTYASPMNTGIYEVMRDAARDHKITIIGSVMEKVDANAANCLTVVNPDGEIAGTYRKLHLFRLFDEHLYLQQGESPLSLEMDWGQTGFGICYDLRFPELFRLYSIEKGARVIVLPAEWPLIRIEHWRTLITARAIENQAFVIACNSAAKTGDVTFGGHSMIVDPWGKIVVEAGEAPQLITATIETATIDEVGRKIPVFDDLRKDIYG